MAVKHWNCFLEGSKFKVLTDHHSLIWLNKLSDPSRRQSRWIDVLQGHDFEVLYIKGETNPADAFTRVPYQHDAIDENDVPIQEPLLVLRTMQLALQESGISIKVNPLKLKEWQDVVRQCRLQLSRLCHTVHTAASSSVCMHLPGATSH
jgi:hypothetical protein